MKVLFSERNIVIALFIAVLVTFSLAQEETRKVERLYTGTATTSASQFLADIESQP